MANQSWALVTGASTGIGREIAQELARIGWNLILVARREKLLLELAAQIRQDYPQIQVKIQAADLMDSVGLEKVQNLISDFPIDFFVNNAGILDRGVFDERPLIELQKVIQLNVLSLVQLSHFWVASVKGRFLKAQTSAPADSSKSAYLLNVGSVNSYVATGESAIYSGSKAFVKSFSVALAEELTGTGIRVCCLCPGPTESGILDLAGMELVGSSSKWMMSAKEVAIDGIESVMAGDVVCVPGWTNKLTVFLSRLLPELWMTGFASILLRRAMKRK